MAKSLRDEIERVLPKHCGVLPWCKRLLAAKDSASKEVVALVRDFVRGDFQTTANALHAALRKMRPKIVNVGRNAFSRLIEELRDGEKPAG